MSIQRAIKDRDNPYFASRRDTAQDRVLSYEARGILWYLLSKPDDWKVEIQDLVQPGYGRNRIYRILKELIDAKYLEHTDQRDDKKHITSWNYVVYERPNLLPENLEVGKLEVGSRDYTEYREEQNRESTSCVAAAPPASDIDNVPPSKELTAFKEKHAVDRLSGVAVSSSQAMSDTAVEGTKTLPEKLTSPPDHTSRSNESAAPSEMSDTAIQDRTHFTSPPPPPLQIPEGYEAAYSSDGVVHLYKAKIKHPTTCAKCHKHFDTWSQIPGGKHYEPCSLWVVPAPPDAVMERLSVLCYGTLDQLKVNGTWGYLRQVYNDLYPAVGGITAGQVEVFRERWYKNFWKGRDKRERPTPKDIKDNWLSLMTADTPAQAAVDKTSIAWLMGPEAKAEARRMAELRDSGEDET